MTNIVTFGSCLSRYIARSYKRLFAGNITNSVYHNRSDYFVNSFIKKNNNVVNQSLMNVLQSKNTIDINDDASLILLNQTIEGLGQHKIENSHELMDNLQSLKIDILIIDNFMDISARLSSGLGFNFFARPNDYKNYEENFSLGGFITTSESIENFNTIIKYFKSIQPTMKIVFVHFPYNTYGEDSNRKDRSLSFYKEFNNDSIIMIPPLSIPKIYRTEVASHFQEPQYTAYAGMINILIK